MNVLKVGDKVFHLYWDDGYARIKEVEIVSLLEDDYPQLIDVEGGFYGSYVDEDWHQDSDDEPGVTEFTIRDSGGVIFSDTNPIIVKLAYNNLIKDHNRKELFIFKSDKDITKEVLCL
jgi:hypothetical protein